MDETQETIVAPPVPAAEPVQPVLPSDKLYEEPAPETLKPATGAEQQASAEIESRFEQKLRAAEERLEQKFASQVERSERANRESLRQRIEGVRDHFSRLYAAQAAAIDRMASDDPMKATSEKLAWRDYYDREALAETQKLAQQPPAQPIPQRQPVDDFENFKRDILEEYGMTGSEPEYTQVVVGKWKSPRTAEASRAHYEKLVKEASELKEARVTGKAQSTQPPKKPTMTEPGGGGGGRAGSNKTQIAAEMDRLMKEQSGDPSARKARLERLEQLSKDWETAAD